MKIPCAAYFIGLIATCNALHADVVTLTPSQDDSIYSESDNDNGLGDLFAGVTNQGDVRRALIEFNLAAAGIPAGAIINSVTLNFTLSRAVVAQTATFELHPLLRAWMESTSSGVGQGASPTLGGPTWNYQSYGSTLWTAPGGDFAAASGTTSFARGATSFTFGSQSGMVEDVQGWLNNPSTNFGWLLKDAAETVTSARALASRESGVSTRPMLTISYTAVPEPCSMTLTALGVVAAAATFRHRKGSGC